MIPSNNPYSSPVAFDSPSEGFGDRSRLRAVAAAQRHLNLSLLAYLGVVPFFIAVVVISGGAEWGAAVVLLYYVAVAIYGCVSIFRLAAILRGNLLAVVYTLAMLVPLLGLVLLLILNAEATTILRQSGIKVGFLGADPRSIK